MEGMQGDRTLAPTERTEAGGPDISREDQEESETREGRSGDDDGQAEVNEDGAEEESRPQRSIKDPGQPTAAEVEEHNLTHIPYRPWCEYCVRGKAKRRPSRRLCGAYSESTQARIRMDYAYLTESVEDATE